MLHVRPWRDEPGPGQRSVWDNPRPPVLEAEPERIVVVLGGVVVADTGAAWRVLETSHPPTYYLPPDDFAPGVLEPADGSSFCEWKGVARYWTLVAGGERRERAAWSYPSPTPAFASLAHHVALYRHAVDRATVGGIDAEPQPGGFYGGWVTPRWSGPFKGIPGSQGW